MEDRIAILILCGVISAVLVYSCTIVKGAIGRDDPPIMTNRQLTDSLVKVSNELNAIKKTMLMPDPSMFEMRNGLLVFKSRVAFDSLQVKGWLYVGVIKDTIDHHVRDSLIIAQ